MQQTRPRLYPAAKPALTVDEKVAALQKGAASTTADLTGVKADLSDLTDVVGDQGAALDMVASTVEGQGDDIAALETAVAGLPATGSIWSDARPTATFGDGSDLTWTGTGNGVATTFSIPGRLSTAPTRYVVLVGGVRQAPAAYSLSTSAARP
ncbi:hypothetical protein [Azospirillum agricola]|uniref:hypothetical protein n=1 Tax=Azospirillum agricola TaxID=1720247 RepID=UPI000A0EF65E|nr:hypothetical protein [Azospirillum agricola]SMH60431.1 hypothetical protein SAMN02982994_5499 [Azospirillum lipoferum]